jgi:hypothetical protein
MRPPLHPGPSLEAGRAHGQLASRLPGTGLSVTCHKLIGSGWRALVLIVPEVFRMDVRPVEDTLQVMMRPISPVEGAKWGAQPTSRTDWGKRGPEIEIPWRGTWHFGLKTPDWTISGDCQLLTSRDDDTGGAHISAFAVLREAPG